MLQKFSKCEVTTYTATQILREITFGELKRLKVCFLAILEVIDFDFGEYVQFFKAQIY